MHIKRGQDIGLLAYLQPLPFFTFAKGNHTQQDMKKSKETYSYTHRIEIKNRATKYS